MSASTLGAAAPQPSARLHVRAFVAVLVALLASSISADTALAHTDFESSDPAPDAVVDESVDVITIVFTGEATPVGDEFVALTPDGVVQPASSIETVDDKTFTIRFDPPLSGGEIGVRWNVQAADSHPIEGAFSFTVNAPAPTTEPAPTTTVAPTTPASAPEATAAIVVAVPTTTGITTTSTTTTSDLATNSEATGASAPTSLDEFLAVDNSAPGQTTATIGRVIGLLGVALGLGALAFVASALRGRRDEIHRALTAIRVLGAVIAVGASIEYVGVARIGPESIGSNWSTSHGFATVLRIVGGVALAVGVAETITRGRRPSTHPATARPLSAAVIPDAASTTGERTEREPVLRWAPDKRSWPALVGALVIVASFWFDGHTVNNGFRPLHALVNSIHVVAGSVWVGGVVMMAAIIWSRSRSAQPLRIVEMVIRFSRIATLALGAVVAAGVVMAFLVLDGFGELTSTTWGQILLLKTAAVGLAIIGGAYNHYRLLPALESDPESPELLDRLRGTVTAEAIVLVFVVAVTAWLVAAAT